MASEKTAPVKWAQRKDSLYITIDLRDVTDEKISLTKDKMTFSGKSGDAEYSLEFEFFKPVDPEASKWNVLPRSVQMHIFKEDKEEEEFWPRLLQDKKLEKTNVKIDWDKWIDEDDEHEDFDTSNMAGGMDFMNMMGGGGGMPGMGGMGGMPGMGGMGGMPGMGDMDLSQMMASMGGMGGMGAEEDEEDSDDEPLPDLNDDPADPGVTLD